MQRKLHFDWLDLPQLIENGLGLREIARLKGTTHSSVRKAIKRMEIPYCYTAKMKRNNAIKNDKFIAQQKRGKWAERIIIMCDFCGKKMERLRCKSNKGKHCFCCRKCKSNWLVINVFQTIEYREKKRQISLLNGNKPPISPRGENHWNWKGGMSGHNRGQDTEFCKWRKAVFSKGDYTCQICGVRGKKLSGHHIKEWAKYPELRYDVNNGQCLCYKCHMKLHGLTKKTA